MINFGITKLQINLKVDLDGVLENSDTIGNLFFELKDKLPETETIGNTYIFKNDKYQRYLMINPENITFIINNDKDHVLLDKSKEILDYCIKAVRNILSIQKCISQYIIINFNYESKNNIVTSECFATIQSKIFPDLNTFNLGFMGFEKKLNNIYIRFGINPTNEKNIFDCYISCFIENEDIEIYKENLILLEKTLLEEVNSTISYINQLCQRGE